MGPTHALQLGLVFDVPVVQKHWLYRDKLGRGPKVQGVALRRCAETCRTENTGVVIPCLCRRTQLPLARFAQYPNLRDFPLIERERHRATGGVCHRP